MSHLSNKGPINGIYIQLSLSALSRTMGSLGVLSLGKSRFVFFFTGRLSGINNLLGRFMARFSFVKLNFSQRFDSWLETEPFKI